MMGVQGFTSAVPFACSRLRRSPSVCVWCGPGAKRLAHTTHIRSLRGAAVRVVSG